MLSTNYEYLSFESSPRIELFNLDNQNDLIVEFQFLSSNIHIYIYNVATFHVTILIWQRVGTKWMPEKYILRVSRKRARNIYLEYIRGKLSVEVKQASGKLSLARNIFHEYRADKSGMAGTSNDTRENLAREIQFVHVSWNTIKNRSLNSHRYRTITLLYCSNTCSSRWNQIHRPISSTYTYVLTYSRCDSIRRFQYLGWIIRRKRNETYLERVATKAFRE